jgi:hypothetical protein
MCKHPSSPGVEEESGLNRLGEHTTRNGYICIALWSIVDCLRPRFATFVDTISCTCFFCLGVRYGPRKARIAMEDHTRVCGHIKIGELGI